VLCIRTVGNSLLYNPPPPNHYGTFQSGKAS
jgi:hypothetical protein